jgi:RNA polymerase sigma-70 factor (ECF subfamily)
MKTIVQKILEGDSQAVIAFYKTYSPRIHRYLQKKLPPEAAQEILNDVFLDAIDSLATMHKQTNLQAWLFQIAHHNVVDYYRKKKIKSFLFSQMPYLELVAGEMHQPEFILEKNKIKEKIETVMRSLSEKYRTILKMHYEEQIPVKLIAVELNLSFKATESLLYRARKDFIKVYERT